MIKKETRGRKPLPLELRKPPQATIKINDVILPFVKKLKGNLKKGKVTKKTIERLFNVINNNWEQVSAVDKEPLNVASNDLQQVNLSLVIERDSLKLQASEAFANARHLKGVIARLEDKIDYLEHIEHGCQSLKSSGDRCTRPAVTKIKWHGVEIHTCVQHSKILKK